MAEVRTIYASQINQTEVSYPPSTISSRQRRIKSRFSSADLLSTLFLEPCNTVTTVNQQIEVKDNCISLFFYVRKQQQMKMEKPKKQPNCIKESLKHSRYDELILIVSSSNKKVKVLNEFVDDNVTVKHCYLSCKWSQH